MHPNYSRSERRADAAIHGLGVVGSTAAAAVLWATVIPEGGPRPVLAAVVYGIGLVAMLWLSAAYNLAAHPGRKERLRRFDHAAIFLMIAGTYTPFALVAVGGPAGAGLLAVVWAAAVAGMLLKLLAPRRLERASVILYLVLGWSGLAVLDALIAALPASTLALLGIGGLLYTVGAGFHLWRSLPYQNAVWHGLVLAAAACHFAAVLEALAV